ncbi:hypothetical protein G6F57_014679 [Rhizopus arrhizus]|nr:hypothetical protein G6F57_014679 [Rhizopus arrhizus]
MTPRSLPRALALGALIAAATSAQAAPDGKQISTQGANGAPACITCHGARGEGNPAAGFPQLAGIGAKYLAEQLEAMANGSRVSPVMAATAKALDPAQQQAVASYYASLPSPLHIARLAAAATQDVEAAAGVSLQRWFTPGFQAARPERVAAIGQRLLRNDRANFLAAYRLFAQGGPILAHAAPDIACPALAMTGEEDVGSTAHMTRGLARLFTAAGR